jgi:outer membrane protein assembly factor BamA
MSRRSLMNVAVVLGTLACCSAMRFAPAQTGSVRATLAAIHVTGSQRFKEHEIAEASGLKIGSAVSRADLDAAAQRLIASGAFAHVGFRYGPAAGGVAVAFQVTDAEQFLDCRFANLIWVPESQLLAELKSRVPLFDGQVPTAGGMDERIDRALEAILREHRVIASVDHAYFQNSMHAPVSAEVFTAHGSSLPIREVVFTGNTVVGSGALAKAIEPLIGHEHDEVFEEEFFRGDPADLYVERGYLRIAFGRPQPAFINAGGTSGPVRITVPVTEGLQYDLGEIAWSGNSALSSDELMSQIRLEPGKAANGVQLDQNLSDVAELYGTHGYLTARAQATPSFDDASHMVNYQITVTEGDQYHMGAFVVIGIDGAHADMLKHDCKLRRGDPFDPTYWKYFLVINTSDLPAGADKSKKTFKNQVDHDNKTVDVTLTFNPPVEGSSDVVGPVKSP